MSVNQTMTGVIPNVSGIINNCRPCLNLLLSFIPTITNQAATTNIKNPRSNIPVKPRGMSAWIRNPKITVRIVTGGMIRETNQESDEMCLFMGTG